jgi:hypothetical protein
LFFSVRSLAGAAAITLTIAIAATIGATGAELTDEQKADILKRAYHYNGDSMVRWGSIDIRELPAPIKTQRVAPTEPTHWSLRDRTLTPPPLDCKRHGPRKPADDRCKE